MKVNKSFLLKIIKEEIEAVKKDVPVTGQNNAGLCGPASLRAVLKYYKDPKTEEKLAALSDASVEEGTWAHKLVKAAQSLGYAAKIIDDCDERILSKWLQSGPVIINWFDGGGHYSVATGINEKQINIMDPANGGRNRKLPLNQFMDLWFDFEGDNHTGIVRNRMIVVRPRK